jgi:hypothetical protein
MAKIGFILLVALSSFTQAQEPRWSISTLNGQRSHQDGANCFNAVLAAKGFEDFLSYTDSSELKYYLENFCSIEKRAIKKGEILVVAINGLAAHAAIALNKNTVFEKASTAGVPSPTQDNFDNRYLIKKRADSEYLQGCNSKNWSFCRIHAYKCDTANNVRTKMSACSFATEKFGLPQIRREFNHLTMTGADVSSLSNEALAAVKNLTSTLDTLSYQDSCSIYVLTVASSTSAELGGFERNETLTPAWREASLQLSGALKSALFKFRKMDITGSDRRILKEITWFDPHGTK